MSKLNKKLTATIIALPLILGATGVAAFGDNDGKGHRKGGHGAALIQKLDLTAEQKAEIKQIRESSKEAMKEQRGDKHESMHALLTAESFDEAAAQALIAEKEQTKEARQINRLKNQHAIYNVLTEEQQAQLLEIKQEHMGKMEKKMGKKHKKGE